MANINRHILVIGGSPRKFGRTRAITQYAEEALKREGLAVRRLELAELELPMYDGTSEQETIISVSEWKRAAMEADGFFIASPDYHNGMSGALKNALDYLGGEHFRRKPTAIVSMSGGGKGGMTALINMRTVLRGLYALVIAEQTVVDKDQIDDLRTLADPGAVRRVDTVVHELVWLVKALKSKD